MISEAGTSPCAVAEKQNAEQILSPAGGTWGAMVDLKVERRAEN